MGYAAKPPIGYIDFRHPLSKGLVGYWPMCEKSGDQTLDATGKNGNGVYDSSNAVWDASPFGTCIDITSPQQFDTRRYTELEGVKKMTMMMWGYKAAAGNILTVGKFGAAGGERVEITPFLNSLIYWVIGRSGFFYGTSASGGVGWNHYVMVYDGYGSTNADRLKGYLNGIEQTLSFAGTIPSTLSSTSFDFSIGASAVQSTGKFACVGLWDRCLCPTDVSLLYHNSFIMLDKNKTSQWIGGTLGASTTYASIYYQKHLAGI